MLVLARKKDETVIIDGKIKVTVVSINRDKVRLGFTAPPNVTIHRGEVQERIEEEVNHVNSN